MNAASSKQIMIIGSGFGGSILAAILAKAGISVMLVDHQSHPRFAIGESSTPTATFILKSLVKHYQLTELEALTSYGLWKQKLFQVGCGVKRGFSYFFHSPGSPVQTTDLHQKELLVAASSSHSTADTQWYRQDVDAYLLDYAKRCGATCILNSKVVEAKFDEQHFSWTVQLDTNSQNQQFDWIIDASGPSQVMCELTDVTPNSKFELETNTAAIYGHFEKVRRYDTLLEEASMDVSDFPFSSDDAAQHHMMQHQWLWSLRFDNGITSLGLVIDLNHYKFDYKLWESMLNTYPAISQMLFGAIPHKATPILRYSDRLQRLAPFGYGPGWVALPHTIGFVDPLHSTGIAHTLSGVDRLARILTKPRISRDEVRDYSLAIYRELRLIDRLVAGCYKLMPSKAHFEAYCMLYFAAAHNYETRCLNLGSSELPAGIFLSDDVDMTKAINFAFDLASETAACEGWENIKGFEQQIRNLIAPFNQIGLCDPDQYSMYSHTSVL